MTMREAAATCGLRKCIPLLGSWFNKFVPSGQPLSFLVPYLMKLAPLVALSEQLEIPPRFPVIYW